MIYQQPQDRFKSDPVAIDPEGDADMPLRLDCTRTSTWDHDPLSTAGLSLNGSKSLTPATAGPRPQGANSSLPQTDITG
jgi:hypothetical protein